jgi:hypothetical protein
VGLERGVMIGAALVGDHLLADEGLARALHHAATRT